MSQNASQSQNTNAAATALQQLHIDDDPKHDPSHQNVRVKVPKGTRDFSPQTLALRDRVFHVILSTFRRHGSEEIDTPVFELKETLSNKYGEDSKLIYNLEDQGGELLSMRYDLTVPLARYVAINKLDRLKRHHLAKVYRRDNPSAARGRFREFYQCDFDICGVYEAMAPDVECCKVVVEILLKLHLGPFVAKINHRKILDAYMSISGVPPEKIRAISSSIDKLDKLPWEKVCDEMVHEKGLSPVVADHIKQFVTLSGGPEILDQLQARPDCANSTAMLEGIADMRLFFEYANAYGITQYISFDLSLARGLDYYTGCIYEFVLHGDASATDPETSVGSIAAGGRYDDLVGMFTPKNRKVPAVGVSVGVERIMAILERKIAAEGTKLRTKTTMVLVTSTSSDLFCSRLSVASTLWDADISAEILNKRSTKMLSDFQYCEDHSIPLCVIIAPIEYLDGSVLVRDIPTRKEEKVALTQLISHIKGLLNL